MPKIAESEVPESILKMGYVAKGLRCSIARDEDRKIYRYDPSLGEWSAIDYGPFRLDGIRIPYVQGIIEQLEARGIIMNDIAALARGEKQLVKS